MLFQRLVSAGGQERGAWASELRVSYFFVIFYGLGIAYYFSLDQEPTRRLVVAAFCGAVIFLVSGFYFFRSNSFLSILLLLVTALAAGLLCAKLRTDILDTRSFYRSYFGLEVKGCVEDWEPKGKAVRVVLSNLTLPYLKGEGHPDRLRVTLRKIEGHSLFDLAPGVCLKGKAVIAPFSGPLRPDGFSFRRQAYFQGLGGTGFALGSWSVVENDKVGKTLYQNSENGGPYGDFATSLAERWSNFWVERRQSLYRLVRNNLPPEQQGIATVFLTGQKGWLTEREHEAFKRAGLAHLLAISGLHMGLFAGIAFSLARLIGATIPFIALNYPLKKIAAIWAIVVSFWFLCLIGSPVPAQRAFVMVMVGLLAIVVDRQVISLRLIFIAAFFVLFFRPESLLSVSFQMSFAAVLALVTLYQALKRKKLFYNLMTSETILGRVLWWFLSLLLCSFFASLATIPFVIYHFQAFSLLGVLSNLLAVPYTAFVVMPSTIIVLIAWLFGGAGALLTLAGYGFYGLGLLADYFSDFPGGLIGVPATPSWMVSVTFASLFLACLLRGLPRLSALLGLFIIFGGAALYQYPFMMISPQDKLLAVYDDRRLYLSQEDREKFLRKSWTTFYNPTMTGGFFWEEGFVQRENQKSNQTNMPTGHGMQCGELGCNFIRRGYRLSYSFNAMGLDEDCSRSQIVVTDYYPMKGHHCQAALWGPYEILKAGGIAIFFDPARGYSVMPLIKSNRKRPWS